MSFQTFNLFNFFQQPNSGKHKILSPQEKSIAINPEVNNSGAVADFNWFFPYANKIIPNAVILGGFPILLYSDSYEPPIQGARYIKSEIDLSGTFFKDIHKVFSNLSFSGTFFPKDFNEQENKIYISGSITGSPPDKNLFKLNISGDVLDVKYDYNYLNNHISGSIFNSNVDFPSIKLIFTGIIESGNIDSQIFKNKISGSFFPLYNDVSNLNYSLSEYTFGINFEYIDEILEDEINKITYSLEAYVLSD